jgi:hypothetical protein
MKISRQVGTVSEVLNIFVQDATVSTGAGLANIVASSVSFAWFRSDQATVSTGTGTTGTLGTYGVSSFVQALSNGALGWYQFSPPNGVFVSGRTAAIHLYGAPSMAPLPIEIELTKTDNQTYFSSQALSTNALVNVNLILGSTPVTSAAGTLKTDLTSIYGTAPVTNSAGILATVWDLSRTANLTSTIALTATTLSTEQLVNVNQILGSTPVTSAAGTLKTDLASIFGTAPVTTSAGIMAHVWDLGRTANLTSTIALTATTLSTEQLVNVNQIFGSPPVTSAAGTLKVDLTSIYGTAPVTTAAGIFATVFDLGRTANAGSTVALTALSVAYATTVGSVTGAVGSVAGLNAALVDVSVSSRLAAAAYTTPPTVAQITTGVLGTTMAESYRASGATGTLTQVAYELLAHLGEASISGTTKTIKKTDQVTVAGTFTLDSSTAPAAITRAT